LGDRIEAWETEKKKEKEEAQKKTEAAKVAKVAKERPPVPERYIPRQIVSWAALTLPGIPSCKIGEVPLVLDAPQQPQAEMKAAAKQTERWHRFVWSPGNARDSQVKPVEPKSENGDLDAKKEENLEDPAPLVEKKQRRNRN
jgi:hypothetical protein